MHPSPVAAEGAFPRAGRGISPGALGVSVLILSGRPWPKPELREENPRAEQPPPGTVEWFTSPQAIAKGNNLQQGRPGTPSPAQLMPEEDTHIPWDTRSSTLLSGAEEVKLQLDLLCRGWLGLFSPCDEDHSPKDTALVAGPEP